MEEALLRKTIRKKAEISALCVYQALNYFPRVAQNIIDHTTGRCLPTNKGVSFHACAPAVMCAWI